MSNVASPSMAITSLVALITLSAAMRTPIVSLRTSVSTEPVIPSPASILGSGVNPINGMRIPTFKSPEDIEVLIHLFKQYCLTQNVVVDRNNNLLLMALDESTFTVVQRELTDAEWAYYETAKKHSLERFDLLKDAGQKSVILRQARRKHGQNFEELNTALLGMAAKALPEESSSTVDRMTMDLLKCDFEEEKVRLNLIEKAPNTSREAFSLAVAYQAAIKYNDSLRESSLLISTMYSERV